MTQRLMTSIIGAWMLVLALAACGTMTGAAVGAGGGAAIGYGTGYGATMHEVQASADTLRDVAVGGRVDAKLREAPKCS